MSTARIVSSKPGAERQAHLSSYLIATVRDLFPCRADLASFSGLDKLRRTLTADIGAALTSIGLTPAAAENLATEAVGAALARGAVKWLRDKLG